jgi:hypothetical protein
MWSVGRSCTTNGIREEGSSRICLRDLSREGHSSTIGNSGKQLEVLKWREGKTDRARAQLPKSHVSGLFRSASTTPSAERQLGGPRSRLDRINNHTEETFAL